MEDESDGEMLIELKVRKSAISSVERGIARMHSSHMEDFPEEEKHMVTVRYEKRSIVAKLVSDRFATPGHLILREGDMKDLDVKEGDTVTIEPYHKLTDDLKDAWNKLKEKFKKKDEEEEGGE